MAVFFDGTNIIHNIGSRIVWATNRRPANMVPSAAVTLDSFDFVFPDFSKSNVYGFDIGEDIFGATKTSCASYISINPQEWDSGLSYVCDVPASSNYFEVVVYISRIFEPSYYLAHPIPKCIAENYHVMLDGGSVLLERIGPISRIARFEKSGNSIYLRRKQSVTDAGDRGIWTPGNTTHYPGGGKREGWTYAGSPNAWPSYLIEGKSTGDLDKERGGDNACSLIDSTNYASTWRGTVTITPGYIKP